MPVFTYLGKSRLGETLEGEIVATNPKEAVRILRERQVAVTRLRERATQKEGRRPWSFKGGFPNVKSRDVVTMTLQGATMLKSGIPLLQTLDVLSAHTESHHLRSTLTEVRGDVESGLPLAEALRKHPKVFTPFYVHMVEVGETTGMLDHLLSKLADHMERIATVKGRVFSALAYPIILFGMALSVLIFMLIWIVPLFSHMFAEFDQALPWLTLVVLNCGIFLKTHVITVLLGPVVFAIVIRQCYGNVRYRRIFDRFILALPVFGEVLKKSAIVQFTRALGTLVSSGVSILDGLVIAAKVSGNTIIEDSIQQVHRKVREGSTISEPLAQGGIFPPLVSQMIAVGESTGSLDDMLGKIADLYEQEVDRAVSTLTSLFEPIVIVVIGFGIGVMVIAMYLPIFTMGSFIG